MNTSSSSSSSTLGSGGGLGGASGTTGLPAGPLGVTPAILPPRSAVFDLQAVSRCVAIKRYFKRLFGQLVKPSFESLFDVASVPPIGPDNVLLFEAKVLKWSEFRLMISPVPTLFFLPLVIGFAGSPSNILEDFPVTTPYSFLDNGTRFPLGVWVLSKRPGGSDVFIFGGTILPSNSTFVYHGIVESELGSEWVVPPNSEFDLDRLFVILPSDDVKDTFVSMVLKNLPSLDSKVPGISFPISSKNFYVHPDGIFSWPTHDYPRPSGLEEMESRFIIRNVTPDVFQYFMVAHNKIAIDPRKFMERLIAVSLLHEHEVIDPVRAMNGIYHTEVRFLRIMTDEVRLGRFIRGEWPMSYRLDLLSLFHFMPTTHSGFDYLETSRDTFVAFRNFITFLTWIFGHRWSASFEDDIRKWQTSAPWVNTPVWVLHICLEKAISSWILHCHSDASIFRYAGIITSWDALDSRLTECMSKEHLELMKPAYDRSLALQVVYPEKICRVPQEVPSLRPPPRFGCQGVGLAQSASCGTAIQSPARSVHFGQTPIEKLSAGIKRSADTMESSSSSSNAVKPQATRYCHANIAYIFEFDMTAKPPAGCKNPSSVGTVCACGVHMSKGSRPAVDDVIRVIESVKSKRSEYCEELLSFLHSHDD